MVYFALLFHELQLIATQVDQPEKGIESGEII